MFAALLVLCLVVLLLFGLSAAGTRALNRLVVGEVSVLAARAAQALPRKVRLADFPDLPAPVRRYLEFAGVEGRERVRFVRMRQGGTFRPGAGRPWCPMEAVQYYAPDEVAFVWQATIRMFGIAVRGRDRLLEGRGRMLIKLLGFLPLMDLGGPEMDVASLIRYYSEAFWFPTALLPDAHLSWEPIDDSSARARFRCGDVRASGIFRFDDQGRAIAFETEDRYRAVGGRMVRAPWFARMRDFREVQGFMVPMDAEAGWLLPDGELLYARPVAQAIEYDRFAAW